MVVNPEASFRHRRPQGISRDPRVSVIILNWNGLEHLRPCLDSLAGQDLNGFEALVVDNGSADGSAAVIAAEYPWVRLIRNAHNVGFSPACNQGVRVSSASLVAFLNNDAIAHPGWLSALVRSAERHPEAGSIASRMMFQGRTETVNSAGITIDRCGIAWDRMGGENASVAAQDGFVFGACAGAALYRRDFLEHAGMFDEDYFAYMEDVDLAWRGQLMGWRCFYAPQALVWHAHSATSVEGSPFKNYLLGRNKVWTLVKNYPSPDLVRFFPLILAYDLLSPLYRGARSHEWSALRGRLDALRQLPKFLGKRREIQRNATAAGIASAAALMAPVEWPWKIPGRYAHLQTAIATTAIRPLSRIAATDA